MATRSDLEWHQFLSVHHVRTIACFSSHCWNFHLCMYTTAHTTHLVVTGGREGGAKGERGKEEEKKLTG